ncbi:MAG: ribosomal protein S18-alanine N-acetyltransferase [Pseudomonadota bacterium]
MTVREVRVSAPTPAEIEPSELAALHADAFSRADGAGAPWSAAALASAIADPATLFFVARRQGATMGFALGRRVLDETELLTIAVASDAVRSGVGALLLESLENCARDAGAVRIFLEVGVDNAPARALYAKAGFSSVGRRSGYYLGSSGRPQDALILSKSLTNH